MISHSFPSFSKLFQQLRERTQTAFGHGPTWFTQPWFGDTLPGMQKSLLRLLAVAHRERLQVAPLVACMAMEHRGQYRAKLMRLARRLDSGLPLCAALEQTPDVLSTEDVLTIRFATQSGTLGTVWDQLLDDHREDEQTRQVCYQYSSVYWIILAVMIVIVLLFVMFSLAPGFKHRGDEMGVVPPPAFVALQAAFGSPASIAWLIAAVLFAAWLSLRFSLPRRFMAQQVAPRLLKPVAERRVIHLYRMLASTLDLGRPIPGAISTLARYHFDANLRRKLLVARNEIEQGEDVWQSMAQTGVIDSGQAEALQSTQRSDLRAWIFKRLASQKLEAAAARTAALTSLVEPLLVLFFASIVLWICYSFFAYLVRFIQWNA